MAKKILLVDDDRINNALLSFAFKESGYEVVLAGDGQEGLDAVARERPDLIVLDIRMPTMSGFEFMNEIKAFPFSRHIPVIILTADETLQDVFFSAGVKAYFVKPVDPPKLLEKVRSLIGPAQG